MGTKALDIRYCENDGLDAHIENLMHMTSYFLSKDFLYALSFQHVLGKILRFSHNPFENSLSFQHFHNTITIERRRDSIVLLIN